VDLSVNKIIYFQAQTNRLTGPLPTGVENWTNLKTFFISENAISGTLPKDIGGWTLLETLEFNTNRLNGAFGSRRWAKLSVGSFQANALTGSIEGLCLKRTPTSSSPQIVAS
jgi:hypothetical protein